MPTDFNTIWHDTFTGLSPTKDRFFPGYSNEAFRDFSGFSQ